eukprot:14783032-Alexandrium_andersonii.AAC.1
MLTVAPRSAGSPFPPCLAPSGQQGLAQVGELQQPRAASSANSAPHFGSASRKRTIGFTPRARCIALEVGTSSKQ